MLKKIQTFWDEFFLKEGTSFNLGWFRIAFAASVGLHVIPTLIPMADNYLSTAYKAKNLNFFPIWILEIVEQSSPELIWLMVGLFYVAWFAFLVGFKSQISCILTTLCCYYFYALNSMHIGTLSWDILLVTMFLMCVTPYLSDHFSVDSWLRKKKGHATPIERPIFMERLLQLQLSWTFFYTAIHKVVPGNWLQDNPYYYLMNVPDGGVVKQFWFRDVIAASPELCYTLGISVVISEILISTWLWMPKFRPLAIVMGIFFQILLLVTLHVPTIFFFQFIPHFLLFVPAQRWSAWGARLKGLRFGRGFAA